MLRAASTTGLGDDAESLVTTLADRDGRLVRLGAVGGLGRGERIYAVRFLGDTGYVVTFRAGRSALHARPRRSGAPGRARRAEDPRLLGLPAPASATTCCWASGRTRPAAGEVTGLQLSLFDVSDLARPGAARAGRPRRRATRARRPSGTTTRSCSGPRPAWRCCRSTARTFSGAAGFTVSRAGGIAALGQIAHAPGGRDAFAPPVRRAVVVGDRLFTISELGREGEHARRAGRRRLGRVPRGRAAARRADPVRALEPLAQHPEDAAHDCRAGASCPGAS